MRLIQFSTPRFGALILERISKKIKPTVLIAAPDKPFGRKRTLRAPEAKKIALNLGIEVFQPQNLKEKKVIHFLKSKKPDLFLVASYSKIIPKEILEIPKFKTLGLHPSLLPKFRGPSPIQTVILKGEKITGTTLFVLDEKIDHGPILAQERLELKDADTYLKLEEKLAHLSAQLFLENYSLWIKQKIKPQKQNESQATYTKKFNFSDGQIFPERETAQEIERKVRALNPEPGTYLKIIFPSKKIQILKILKVRILKENEIKKSLKPFSFFEFKKNLALKCKKDALLIEILQPEGKKPLRAFDFLLGNQWILGCLKFQ